MGVGDRVKWHPVEVHRAGVGLRKYGERESLVGGIVAHDYGVAGYLPVVFCQVGAPALEEGVV